MAISSMASSFDDAGLRRRAADRPVLADVQHVAALTAVEEEPVHGEREVRARTIAGEEVRVLRPVVDGGRDADGCARFVGEPDRARRRVVPTPSIGRVPSMTSST